MGEKPGRQSNELTDDSSYLDVALFWHFWIDRCGALHLGRLELAEGPQLGQGSATVSYQVEHIRIYVPLRRGVVCLWYWRAAG